jgi:hypothetical protein
MCWQGISVKPLIPIGPAQDGRRADTASTSEKYRQFSVQQWLSQTALFSGQFVRYIFAIRDDEISLSVRHKQG